MKKIFSKDELYSKKPQRSFRADAGEVAFLLGGIGTGNISIGARGELRDFEIFNKPAKGQVFPYTFFSVRTKVQGEEPRAKILEGRIPPPYAKSHGFQAYEMAGAPRFSHSEMRGEYPFAYISLWDEDMPLRVELEAFNPLIPLDADDSGLPCGILSYKLRNITDKQVDFTVTGTIPNMACHPLDKNNTWGNYSNELMKHSKGELVRDEGLTAIHFTNSMGNKESLTYSDLCLSVLETKDIVALPLWPELGWWDAAQLMWDNFRDKGDFQEIKDSKREATETVKPGTLGVKGVLLPGEERTLTFIISWNTPNRINGWYCDCGGKCSQSRNYYALKHENSLETARYTAGKYNYLYSKTKDFHDALFESSLPPYVLDAVSANTTVLRSTTCFRLESGKFFGWEGCFENEGCCEGNCTHVWNYQQTLAFLFPSLERDMRLTEFNVETKADGKMEFRTKQLFGGDNNYHPAADGQLGCIIRLYRDWKLSGDGEFVKALWENAKKALNFAFDYWDKDRDFVLDSQQHNTYDIEFYGPNSLVNSMFFAALKAGAELAEFMGESSLAQRYSAALEMGSYKMDKLLWNGEYYAQMIEDVNEYPYQYGQGCLSDQLLGQELAHVAGLSYILPKEHVGKALKSIFDYNFTTDFSNHYNIQRAYVLNDEKGLLLCTWPKGGRPTLPFTYSDEVWTGFEYQVATHLIYEGYVDEALTIVKALRDRHDGYRRNPWNEVECGNHYARSMASWGLLIAISGYKFDLVKGELEFSPVKDYPLTDGDFSFFFSCDKGWGRLVKSGGKEHVEVLFGDLSNITFKLNGRDISAVCKEC